MLDLSNYSSLLALLSCLRRRVSSPNTCRSSSGVWQPHVYTSSDPQTMFSHSASYRDLPDARHCNLSVGLLLPMPMRS